MHARGGRKKVGKLVEGGVQILRYSRNSRFRKDQDKGLPWTREQKPMDHFFRAK